MKITRKQIESQFKRIVADGWLPWFQENAKRAGTTTAHLLGLGSRETNLKNIRGDYRDDQYHGFGVLQVDIGTDPEYARVWNPGNVEHGIIKGVDIYLSKVSDTKACVGKTVSVKGHSFTGKAVEPDDLRRVATAAYNCGRWAHYHFSRGENVDSTTTGKDYSRDVYDRSIEFAYLLEQGAYEKDAVSRELNLQGKYARDSHKERFAVKTDATRVKLPMGEAGEVPAELEKSSYGRDDPIEPQAKERIAVVQTKPEKWTGRVWAKATGAVTGNAVFQWIWAQLEKIQALSVPEIVWIIVSLTIAIVSILWILHEIIQTWRQNKYQENIDSLLVKENSTPDNLVQLIPADEIELYRMRGFKIITRGEKA